ncbi:SWI/SNF complex subunit SMARCC2 [Geodia barretti]|uniref:SWI/SNF complex subunit SMARCC2 n=2 Tax=Geodia barretti TaxID=519541 RepID=A0AA35TVY3_GEOBA|nr:SWI/SNF complex subunit SMARCC2 [Geodia barretti]
MVTRKKNGAPDSKHFEAPETVAKFEPVKQWLLKNCRKYTQADPPSNKNLAMLVCVMLQFQEDAMGRHVSNPALTKLPAPLFDDLNPGGSLCHILTTAYRVKTEQSWRRFDFHSPARIDRGMELFITIHRDLVQSKVWEPPKLFFDSSVSRQTVQQLTEIVKRHQGSVVDVVTSASHVIYPAPPPSQSPGDEFFRPVTVKGRNATVHWWYTPDSYDNVIPSSELGGVSVETPPTKQKQWWVSSRWLTDSDLYNEWMNEEDYELLLVDGRLKPTAPYLGFTRRKAVKISIPHEEPEPIELGSRRSRSKRRRTPSPPVAELRGSSKRKKTATTRRIPPRIRDDDQGSGVGGGGEEGEGEGGAVEEDVTKEMPNPAPLPKVEEVPLQSLSREATPTTAKLLELTPVSVAPSDEVAMDTNSQASSNAGSSGTMMVSPPKEAPSSITTLPQTTPTSSLQSSASMETASYQQQPQQQSGDAMKPEPPPTSTSSNGQPSSSSLSDQERRILSSKDSFPGTEVVVHQAHNIIIPSYSAWFHYNSINAIEKRSLPEFFNGKNRSKTPEIYLAYRNFMIDSFRLNPTEYLSVTSCRRNLAGDVGAILRVHGFLEQWGLTNYHVDNERQVHSMGPPSTAHFNVQVDTPMGVQPLPPSKTGQSASDQLVQLTDRKKDGETLTNGNFGLRGGVYGKEDSSMKPWTEQETLLLLEALELHQDDWNKVAQHVSSRTQDECILHFLKLPIEDRYLEEVSLGPLAFQPVPFSHQGNPVMSTVAFLASVVDPRVASAAAKAALAEFTKMKEELPKDLAKNASKPGGEKNGEDTKDSAGGERVKESSGGGEEGVKASGKEGVKESVEKSGDKGGEGGGTLPEALSMPGENSVQSAAASALAAAAVKAKHLALVEERKIKSLVALLVETQMKKLEIKLKHFEELETIMDRERETLELQRQQLLADRQQFQRDQIKASELRALQSPTLAAAPSTPLQFPPSRPPLRSPTLLTPSQPSATMAIIQSDSEGSKAKTNAGQVPMDQSDSAVTQASGSTDTVATVAVAATPEKPENDSVPSDPTPVAKEIDESSVTMATPGEESGVSGEGAKEGGEIREGGDEVAMETDQPQGTESAVSEPIPVTAESAKTLTPPPEVETPPTNITEDPPPDETPPTDTKTTPTTDETVPPSTNQTTPPTNEQTNQEATPVTKQTTPPPNEQTQETTPTDTEATPTTSTGADSAETISEATPTTDEAPPTSQQDESTSLDTADKDGKAEDTEVRRGKKGKERR